MSNRLRVIAGPNGSGKSSIFQLIKKYREQDKAISTGPFINSDQIEKQFREDKYIRLSEFGIETTQKSIIQDYLKISTLKSPYDPAIINDLIVFEDECFKLVGENSSAHLGMVISDLIREELLRRKISFTMETVFSHPDKVNFMQRAKDDGFKVYLYFVSTENPEINIKRIEGRVAGGGHDVPSKKIIERYDRTMNNLQAAIKIAYRAYVFDNSGDKTLSVAEKDKEGIIYLAEKVPEWLLKYLHISEE